MAIEQSEHIRPSSFATLGEENHLARGAHVRVRLLPILGEPYEVYGYLARSVLLASGDQPAEPLHLRNERGPDVAIIPPSRVLRITNEGRPVST